MSHVQAPAGAARRIRSELEQLVAISSPSGDIPGAEAAIALCEQFLGPWSFHRLPCSTAGSADDLLARLRGTGTKRLLLLGHLDTVIAHDAHAPVTERDGRLYGSGTADMKGGVAISLELARELAATPERFQELAVLLVCDEEWRTAPFRHAEQFAGYDACLCFEAGEQTPSGDAGVIVRRKGAGTLRVRANGRAAHSGSAPHLGRNALLALSRVALELAALSDPEGPERLTVVPTVMHSGDAFNVVPAQAELVCDLRCENTDMFERVRASVPEELGEVQLTATLERVWPAMDAEAVTAPLLQRAGELLGRPVVARRRGGASDASHFAPVVPLTVDGLGPRGGDAHNPGEFVLVESLGQRLEVALAVAFAALE